MKTHGGWILVITLILVFGLAQRGIAQSPLNLLFPFRQIDADPKKKYEVREEHGPWLIVAATFLGESGEQQAHRLVLELRKRYKLNAYVYKREFDYGKTVRGLGVNKYGRPKMMKHVHSSQFEEIAVLVGDFASFDDPRAQTVLERLKHAKPETLNLTKSNSTSQRMAVWREIQRYVTRSSEVKKKGPMRAAFITRNPILPAELFAPKGPDVVIVELNRGLQHSLLECTGNYTVRVATFRGNSTWNVKEIEHAKHEVRSGVDERKSRLAQGAKRAEQLTFALRKRGVAAYQFHDRHESIVSVGAFESVGHRRRDGKIEINPEIHRIMKDYGAQVQNLPGLHGAMAPRTLDGITFDAQPIPVKVPRM